MGAREKDPRIEEIEKSGGKLYSISRLNTINQCPYQAYLRYVAGVKGREGIWGIMGGRVHDALEDVVWGASESCILNAIESELDYADTMGIEFPLDRFGNPSIRNNWVRNMKMFAKNFKFMETMPIEKGEYFETEELVLYPIKDNVYMQGYIDLIKHNDDGTIDIFDWKTSSQFDKSHLVEAGRQLAFYAMAKEAEGFKVRNVAWVMLKYCVSTWGTKQQKVSEWRNVGKDLSARITKDLEKLGLSDIEIESMINKLVDTNSLEHLPEEIKNKYVIKPYIRYYELTPEVRQETLDYINRSIEMFEEFGDNEDAYKPLDCFDESFFCNNLCGYGAKPCKCKHYADYLVTYGVNDDEMADLFA